MCHQVTYPHEDACLTDAFQQQSQPTLLPRLSASLGSLLRVLLPQRLHEQLLGSPTRGCLAALKEAGAQWSWRLMHLVVELSCVSFLLKRQLSFATSQGAHVCQ